MRVRWCLNFFSEWIIGTDPAHYILRLGDVTTCQTGYNSGGQCGLYCELAMSRKRITCTVRIPLKLSILRIYLCTCYLTSTPIVVACQEYYYSSTYTTAPKRRLALPCVGVDLVEILHENQLVWAQFSAGRRFSTGCCQRCLRTITECRTNIEAQHEQHRAEGSCVTTCEPSHCVWMANAIVACFVVRMECDLYTC